jgi:hypothetical protein
MNTAQQIITDAEEIVKHSGISMQQALGQVIGGLIFSIEAELEKTGKAYKKTPLEDLDLIKEVDNQLAQWITSNYP